MGEDALRLYAPIAKENGKTITGLLRGDFMPSNDGRDSTRPPYSGKDRRDRISSRCAGRPA